MILNRRQLLLAAISLASAGVVRQVLAGSGRDSWQLFRQQMEQLADQAASNNVENGLLADRGLQYLARLDVTSSDFEQAVEQSYESGNRFWLWQRLLKEKNVNGGILNIDDQQMVQLHDHPGATGMVRIISGEAEVWLFDEVGQQKDGQLTDGLQTKNQDAELRRVSRRILREGDTAVLTPDKGNIHALRSVSKECRMLDFFIPPYQRSERSWFEPVSKNWVEEKNITCRKISQHDYDET